jgi:2-methylcitrate dehydratase PrpD
MHAIDELAAFVVGHPDGGLPEQARETCSLLVTDLIGATAAGIDSQLAKAARSASEQIFGQGQVDVWLTGPALSIAGAAMANAAAASALDIDDGHRGAAGHAGAGIIPAVLAIGQALNVPDQRIFDALALGYDVGLRVATARPTPTIETYASGRWVNYGVAAAAGRMLGLDARQLAHAMGIAGAEGPIGYPSGSTQYLGSTVKEMIPPAVVAGLIAAFRAKAGATGPRDLLDRDDHFRRAVLTGGLGESWWVQDCYLKPYACCRYMHAAVDGILALRQPGKPIISLRIETFQRGLKLSNERAPQTLEGGQYSYYFSCALAALRGASALQPVDPISLHDPEVLSLAARIELAAHSDFDDAFPESTPCRVVLDQGEGPQSLTVPFPLGDVANPMTRSQVTEKFRRIATANISADRQDDILRALDRLTTDGFGKLFAELGARPGQ